MFTGIVKGLYEVVKIKKKDGILELTIELDQELVSGLKIGASVAINGACLTATSIKGNNVSFDVIEETQHRTNLSSLRHGDTVNVERSLRFGDEIGGHLLSGHVYGTATVTEVLNTKGCLQMTFSCPLEWMKYILPKGFIALDGASLTLVDVWPDGRFSVHLIPETRRLTTFGFKTEGDTINVELDSQTQAIVDTVERIMAKMPD